MNRPQRRARRVVATLVIVALLALGADAGARWFFEREVATAVSSATGLQADGSTARVAGWPFLTQLARNDVGAVHWHADEATITHQGHTLPLRDVQLQLNHLRYGNGQMTPDTGEGSGTLTWQSASELVGGQFARAGQGRVAVTRVVRVARTDVRVVFEFRPVLTGSTIELTEPRIAVADIELPVELRRDVLTQFASLQLPDLGDARFDSLTVTDEGFRLGVSLR